MIAYIQYKLFNQKSKLLQKYYSVGKGYNKLKEKISPDTSIICNNCFGAKISKNLHYRYNSPTVGLFFMYPDYIVFLEDLKHYLSAPLSFKNFSKYDNVNEARKKKQYPIGSLTYKGHEVEIEFMHYRSEAEAKEKWERRCKRVSFKKLLVIGSEVDHCNNNDIVRFMNLNYEDKLFLGKKKSLPNDYPDPL